MTKIAYFLPSLEGGGAERIAITLATGFLQRGYAVDIVLVKAAGALLKFLPAGAQVIDLDASRTLAALPKLIEYLKREKPAALIGGLDHVNMIVIWAKLFSHSQSKVLISTHNTLSIGIKNTPKLQEKIYPLLLKLFHRHADAIMAISKGAADDLARTAKISRSRITPINNPFPISEIIRESAEPVKHPWYSAGQPPIILAVGRLSIQKDYPTLLDAFALLHKHRSVHLIILGEGKERQRLQTRTRELGIQAEVDMPGFSDSPYTFMARSQVFVLSSAWEGFGNVLVEALACGTTVVSTDSPGGPAEILENGKYGYLVPVGNAPALAAALEEALDHPFPPEMLRERARAFSVDITVEKYLKALGLG